MIAAAARCVVGDGDGPGRRVTDASGLYNGPMTRFSNPVYDVQRPTGQCAFTGRALEPAERYVATLVETEQEDLRRLDVSLEAWEAGQRPQGLFSYWKTVVPEAREEPKRLFVDDEVLMNLLHRLADATQPQRIAFRFVLALILMRKKLLRYDGTERRPAEEQKDREPPDERPWWIMTPKLDLAKGPLGKWNEQERIHVLDPQLDEAGIREVTDQLSEILQAEL